MRNPLFMINIRLFLLSDAEFFRNAVDFLVCACLCCFIFIGGSESVVNLDVEFDLRLCSRRADRHFRAVGCVVLEHV